MFRWNSIDDIYENEIHVISFQVECKDVFNEPNGTLFSTVTGNDSTTSSTDSSTVDTGSPHVSQTNTPASSEPDKSSTASND